MPEIVDRKKQLRALARQRLAGLPAERGRMDGEILRHLEQLWDDVSTGHEAVAGYMAIRGEPEVRAFLRRQLMAGRSVLLPRYAAATGDYEMVRISDLAADLVVGRYGIAEPHLSLPGVRPPSSCNLQPWYWLVPALAFDVHGHRLGRGAGYYDRLLAAGGVKIGVGYECQLVDVLPSESHDIGMDYIVTESRILTCT